MAFTPSSSPLQYQYKPLNLMAFAEPLAKMQEKYDLTKSTIEDSDVKATALQWAQDPIKAKALEEIYRNKRDELAQNLAETKNYTQAASKIKKLQRLWNEDPERLALESNAKLWEERNKEELANVASKKITKQQYLEWVADEKRKFESEEVGGTNFRRDAINPNGTYNPVTSKIGREEDRQKEMDELKYKVAEDLKAKKWSSALSSMGIDPMSEDAKYMQSEFEKLTPQEIDQKVETYVRGLDRFKPWLNEVADYNLKNYKYANDNGASYNALAKELVTKNYNANEAYIKSLETAKKKGDKNYSEEDYKNAIKNKEFLREQMDNPDEGVVKDLFNRDYLNKQYDARALGDIFAVNNSSTSYTFRDLPKEDASTSADKDKDLLNGIFTPGTYMPTVGDLNKQRTKAGLALYDNLALVNNIGDGLFRTFVLGTKDSKNRKHLEASPDEQRERQKRLLTLAMNSDNAQEFYKNVKAAGFNSGVTLDSANKLFNSLQNKDTRQFIDNTFRSGEQSFLDFSDAKQQLKLINKEVLNNKDFKTTVSKLGEEKHVTDLATIETLAKAWGKTVQQMINSGVVEKRAGNSVTYTGGTMMGTAVGNEVYVLSGNNLAQVFGYRNLEEAVKEGANISKFNPALGGKIDQTKQEVAANMDNGQLMSHRYTGDKAMNEALNSQFNSIGDLSSFRPATSENWNGTPGFDEEGRLLPGTSFDFANGQSVKLVKHGTSLYYEVPIAIKTKEGADKRTVLVTPKLGTEEEQENLLTHIIKYSKNKDSNPAASEAYDMARSSLYDLKSKNKVTTIAADSYHVDKGEQPIVIDRVPTGKPGTNYEIVKVYVKDRPNTYQVRVKGADGTSSFAYANDGKVFSSQDLNAAKVRVSELLYK